MPVFSLEAPFVHDLDWRLLQNGPITAYAAADALETDLSWLGRAGYSSRFIPAEAMESDEALHAHLVDALELRPGYGRNLNALEDVLTDSNAPVVPEPGLVLGIAGIESQRDRPLLDVLARAAWTWLLMGRRLITLLLIDQHDADFAPVGATTVWLKSGDWFSEEDPLDASGQVHRFFAAQGKQVLLQMIRDAHPASFADARYREAVVEAARQLGADESEIDAATTARL